MDINAPNTKTTLLLTAAELFAEHGIEGVSTRMICDKAGVNLGSIHYHFKTKEALYLEAFKYACEEDERPTLANILEDRPELRENPEGIAQAIFLACHALLSKILRPDKPVWRSRLIIRELSNPSTAMPILVRELFQKEMLADMELFRLIRPQATEEEAMIWAGMIKSQAVFYLMAKAPLEIMRSGKTLGDTFLKQLIQTTARAMILLAGLPVPDFDSILIETPAQINTHHHGSRRSEQ